MRLTALVAAICRASSAAADGACLAAAAAPFALLLLLLQQKLLPGCACRSVCTLYDLERFLAQQCGNVASYNDLMLGPLLANDLVRANFNPPGTLVDIPKVWCRCLMCLITSLRLQVRR